MLITPYHLVIVNTTLHLQRYIIIVFSFFMKFNRLIYSGKKGEFYIDRIEILYTKTSTCNFICIKKPQPIND